MQPNGQRRISLSVVLLAEQHAPARARMRRVSRYNVEMLSSER
jgi:hypothetical protein